MELTCFIFIKSDYIKANLPSFSFSLKTKKYFYHVADINPMWGTWHYAEDFYLKDKCYATLYQINSYGARDTERQRQSTDSNRAVLLGDSFMEGYGLDVNERLSNLLERETGHEVLNFGCSNIGTTQEYLIYKNLADSFNHSVVLIGFHPHTDFFDDDIAYHNTWPFTGYNFYRPFFTGNYPSYRLTYKTSSFDSATFNKEGYFKIANSPKGTAGRFLRAFTCWFNVVDYLRFNHVGSQRYAHDYSGYDDFTEAQLQRLEYILSLIRNNAAGKRIILFTVPIASDVKRFIKENKNLLGNQLKGFCSQNNIELIDLLPVFANKYDDDLFFSCDPHWSAAGNKLAADTLQKLFK